MRHLPSLLRRPLCLLPLLGSLLGTGTVRADEGDGVGFGPLFAFSASDGSKMLGWELAGSLSYPSGRAALGGAYPLARTGSTPGYHYLAWEPWLLAGATLGAALGNDLQPRGVYGVWAALAVPLDQRFDGLIGSDDPRWVVSFSIGWRGVGRDQQFYVTPKIWRARGMRINS